MVGNSEDAFRVASSDWRTGVIKPSEDRFATRVAPDPRGAPSLTGTRQDDGFVGALADDE